MTTMLRRTVIWFLVVGGLVAAKPALASRAGLQSRALPSGLAADASALFLYPAQAGAVEEQVLLDDDVVLGLLGTRVRYGYLVDGNVHNLVMGGASGWGAVVGFRDAYSSNHDDRVRLDPDGTGADVSQPFQYDRSENAERALRLGVGWRAGAPDGRTYEIAIEGSLIQSEGTSRYYARSNNGTVDSLYVGFDGRRGLGAGIGIRTIGANSGLLAALRFSHEDLRPDWRGPYSFDLTRTGISADLGWRLRHPKLDDLVVGLSLSWSDRTSVTLSGGYSSIAIRNDEETAYSGGLFLSGEKEVARDLVVRAGIVAPARFTISEDLRLSQDKDYTATDLFRDTAGSLREPEISMGLGWKWRFLELDGRVSQSISLSYPLVRWAAKFAL